MTRPWIPGSGKINYLAKKDTTHIQSKLARSSSVTIPRKQLKGLEKVCNILCWSKYQCIIVDRLRPITLQGIKDLFSSGIIRGFAALSAPECGVLVSIGPRWCSVTCANHEGLNWKIIIGSCYVERKLECDTRSFPSHNWRKRKNNSKSWIKIGRISSCKSLSLIGCLLGTNLKALFSEPTILDDWTTNKKLKLNFVKLHKQLWIKKLKMFWIKVWLITYDSFRMTSGRRKKWRFFSETNGKWFVRKWQVTKTSRRDTF